MTKSTITRERLEQLANFKGAPVTRQEEQELARMVLAAMDSEPDCKERKLFCSTDTARMKKVISVSAGSEDAPLYSHAQPALAIPDEMTAEQAYEIGYYYGDPVDVFARGANWMRQHIIDSTLAAAPQSPGSEPATVPGKWIPVSERLPLTPSADCEYSDIEVNVFDGERVFTAHYATGSQPQPWGAWEDTYTKITHWQPLPAAPQEVKP